MAAVSFTIATADVPDVSAALCALGGRTPVNAANAQLELAIWIRALVKTYRANRAQKTAIDAVAPSVDPDVT